MNKTFTDISKGILLVFLFLMATRISAQENENRNVVEYHLTIDEQSVTNRNDHQRGTRPNLAFYQRRLRDNLRK